MHTLTFAHAALVLALLSVGAAPLATHAQAPFATPNAAADALLDAVEKRDPAAMARLLGKDWRQLLPVEEIDAEDLRIFLDKARRKRDVVVSDGRGELVVGPDAWALPIPLVQGKEGQWRFDARGGRQAILLRSIGNNELSTLQAMLAYVDAQREYAQADRNGDGVPEYAHKLISSPGRRDGLIWSASLGDDSPLGEAFVPARADQGYHGYHFRILTGQGPHAAGGERSYRLGKRLSSGYALLAWPVSYGKTGVMSFKVNQDGKVFESDLGPRTAERAAAIQRFDPGPGWAAVQP